MNMGFADLGAAADASAPGNSEAPASNASGTNAVIRMGLVSSAFLEMEIERAAPAVTAQSRLSA
jgi:hypothetical protein